MKGHLQLMNKIAIIMGTRPQYMKAIPIINQLINYETIVVDTGQHYDYNMSSIFLNQFKFSNIINLEVGSASHGIQTAKIIEGVEKVLITEQPKLVVVIGDTNTTMGAAIAASKLQIPVAHVEAGCRAYDRTIAEEINRVVADTLSTMLFAASLNHKNNLIQEHQFGKAYWTGDVLFDVLLMHLPKIKKVATLNNFGIDYNFYISTVHRNWNVDNPLVFKNILRGLSKSPYTVILPLHPRAKKNLELFNLKKYVTPNILIMEPISYYDMINLIRYSEGVITDSGGMQREAFYLKKTCISLKESTPEWSELVDYEATFIAGTDIKKIASLTNNLPSFPNIKSFPYGRGNASCIISKIIGDCVG
jgi:UDP-GlcNAc3NAcA epimerase